MNRQSKRIAARHVTLFVIVLTLAGCKSGCKLTEKPSPTPAAVQLIGSGDSYVEMTAAASAPLGGTGPCKDGMILVAAGNGTQQLLMGHLIAPLPPSYDLAGWDGTTWAKRGSGTLPPPPTAATEAPEGSDNQTGRLANGDLLVMWNGSTTSALAGSSGLSWWDDWGTPGNVIPDGLKPRFPSGHRNGYRAAEVFWRYSCTQGKWLTTTFLDGGPVKAMDKNGSLQPGLCVKATPWIAGFDRPELYVDAWGVDPSDNSKQRIYVSTACSRPDDDDSAQVFMSPDSGVTWQSSSIRLPLNTPVVMTTTKDRLFLFQASGSTPIIHWSNDHGASLASAAGGYDITYVTPEVSPNPQNTDQKVFPVGWLSSAQVGVGVPQVPTLSLAHAGPNAVLAVYPSIETVNGSSGKFTRQVAVVVCVIPKGQGEDPILIPIKIFRAQSAQGSVLMPTFIEDDRPDAKTRTNLLYWVETVSPPASPTDPVKMFARYVSFNGPFPGNEALLSDPAGWTTQNKTTYKAMGDYMKGGYYFHNGVMNFVAVWPQVPASDPSLSHTQAYMRIVSLAIESEAGTSPELEKMPGAKPAAPVSAVTPQGKP